ncbi:MAG: helix-turn-helix transcriptional regulator [Candidatus Eisenbacteria bacterium]|uniref:Helix-turn-helix transcriptional regulator n=1 Tax=Eiseniibacteriota bacterium TaxID=2212470 RepID=A0A933SDG7_UNCEI|nr:helix-turn-helix transcriptional regulator [Candidatus Eisenbacteria bacterium]
MDSELRAFGKRVRELRTRKGLSQEALAELSGLHRTYVGGVERGERNIGLKNICALAAALELPVSMLFQAPPSSIRARSSARYSPRTRHA